MQKEGQRKNQERSKSGKVHSESEVQSKQVKLKGLEEQKEKKPRRKKTKS